MNAKFETSKGWVKGEIVSEYFVPNEEGKRLLEELYNLDHYTLYRHTLGHEIVKDWVRIELADTNYGYPEYKLIKSPVS